MMKSQFSFLAFLISIFLIVSCHTSQHSQHSSLISDQYDTSTKSTSFSYLGDFSIQAEIPGKWKYLGFNNTSRDHIFTDSLKQNLFIFKGTRGVSSFNKDNLDGDAFIDLFYKWDSDWYLSQNPNLKTRVLEHISNKYIVVEYTDSLLETTMLYGTKNGNGIRVSITSRVNKTAQTDFVSKVYSNLN